VPSYPYLGTDRRFYGQYKTPDGVPLWAEPGGVYDMWPVPGAGDPPVPPGDGRWGGALDLAVKVKPAASEPAPAAKGA
jgi:hypothetical protein